MRNAINRALQALVLLAVAVSFAQADNFMYFKKKAAGGGCIDDSGDTYNQGFEAAGTPAGWTQKNGTSDFDQARPGTASPAQLCSQSLNVASSAAAEDVYYDYGGNLTEGYVRFYLYFASGTTSSAPEFFAVNQSTAAQSNSELLHCQIYDNDGSHKQIRCCDSAQAACSGWTVITTAAWHLMEVHFINNSASCKFKIDGGAESTFSCTNVADGGRYIWHGWAGAYTLNISYDLFAISTTGYVGAP